MDTENDQPQQLRPDSACLAVCCADFPAGHPARNTGAMEDHQTALDYPLLGLVKHCETLCEAACCGVDAFEFSPIHIASFLIRYTGQIESEELDKVLSQLQNLDLEAERLTKDGGMTSIEVMNQIFTGPALFTLSAMIRDSLIKAVQLVADVKGSS